MYEACVRFGIRKETRITEFLKIQPPIISTRLIIQLSKITLDGCNDETTHSDAGLIEACGSRVDLAAFVSFAHHRNLKNTASSDAASFQTWWSMSRDKKDSF